MHSNTKEEAWAETQPTIDGGYHIPKRCGSRLEVGSNEQLSHFIHHTYGLSPFFFSVGIYLCIIYLFPPQKNPCTRKLGLMSKSVNFSKRSTLCINVSQQCLFIVRILKVCLVFHSSFFSDVCDSAWNKKLIRALLSQPQELQGAGSWILSNSLLSETKEDHSSHPAWSLVLRGTSGRPQEGK